MCPPGGKAGSIVTGPRTSALGGFREAPIHGVCKLLAAPGPLLQTCYLQQVAMELESEGRVVRP